MEWDITYPEYYKGEKVRMHPKCKKDLEAILEGSGYLDEFIRIFRLRLRFLEDKWKSCRLKGNWFEILKRYQGAIFYKIFLLREVSYMSDKCEHISVWNVIDELSSDNTKRIFELDDMLYDISMKFYDYRIGNKLTQKELATKLDVNQSMVSKLESGTYNPTIGQLWKISKKLGWKLQISLNGNNQTSGTLSLSL